MAKKGYKKAHVPGVPEELIAEFVVSHSFRRALLQAPATTLKKHPRWKNLDDQLRKDITLAIKGMSPEDREALQSWDDWGAPQRLMG